MLIDEQQGILNNIQPMLLQIERECGSRPGNKTILEDHALHKRFQTQQTPTALYCDVLATVYRRLAEFYGVSVSWRECQRYGTSVQLWPAFPDSADALSDSGLGHHFELVTLPDVDNESFEASRQLLGDPFNFICTAQDIGSYKPSERNFDYLIHRAQEFGFGKDDILHVGESWHYDLLPAQQAGLATCRINRQMNPDCGLDIPSDNPDFVFNTMAELAKAHKAELAKANEAEPTKPRKRRRS